MSRVIIISLFGLAAVAFVVTTLLSRREGSKVPPFGALTGFVMQYQVGRLPVGRIAVLGFWWWAGWHFFAR
jgi:hypothetical protein